MTARWLSLVLVLALLGGPPRAHAEPAGDTTPYRVRQGDTLELIAAEFYGDRTKAIFIMVANKIVHPRPLRPGERLRVPVTRQVTSAPGETWESLAKSYLGDPRRGSFLAEFNGQPPEDLASGSAISIPFTVMHTASSTETVDSIAAAYFGDTKNASLIRAYNFLDKDAIDKGEQLVVPIFNVRLQASKMPAIDAEAKARRERKAEAQARAIKILPGARQAWREGDFAQVKAALSEIELDVDYLDTAEAVEVGVLLGAMHVAYGDTKPALEAFKRVRERKPAHQLDPYFYPPKILAVWKEADGKVVGEGTP